MLRKILPAIGTIGVFMAGLLITSHPGLLKEGQSRLTLFLVENEDAEAEEENGKRRAEYEWKLMRDPRTGTIPDGIRAREMEWVKSMPFHDYGSLSNPFANSYVPVGPTKNGGRARAFAYDLRYNNTTNRIVLSGGINGGIFRSTDGGATWVFVHPENEVRSVSCFAQDPRPGFQDTWYAGTGEPIGASASYPNAFVFGNGIFKSTDNGQSWTLLSATADDTPAPPFTTFDLVHRLAIDPNNGNVFAAAHRRILRSTNGGTSWQVMLEGSQPATVSSGVCDIQINKAGTRFLASFTGRNPDRNLVGLWTSPTGTPGTWTRLAGGIEGQTDSIPGWKGYDNTSSGGEFAGGWGRLVFDLAPSNQNLLYVLCENSDKSSASKPEADLFKCDFSTTPATWTKLSDNLVAKLNGTTDTWYQAQGGYNMHINVHPTQPNTVFVGGVNLFRSTDGFATKTNVNFAGGRISNTYDDPDDISHVDFHFIAFDPSNPNGMVTASDGGLVSTANSTASKIRWSNLNNQFQTIQYYHIGIDPTVGTRNYYGGTQDNNTTFRDASGILSGPLPDSNDHYILLGGDGGQAVMTAKNDFGRQHLFCSFQEGNVFRLRLFPPFDNTVITPVKPIDAGKGEFVTYYHLDEDNTDLLYYVSEDTMWRTNQAITVTQSSGWTKMNGVEESISGSIFSMATTRGTYSPTHHLFIGTANGKVYRIKDPANVNPGLPATDITPIGMSPGSVVTDIAVNPRNQDTVIAVVSNYSVSSIFWTGNATAAIPTWQVIEGNLSLPSVRSCAIISKKSSPVEYYVGTSAGLYSTRAINGSSTSWVRESGGAMTTAVVTSLAARWRDNVMAIGTHGNGLFAAYIGDAIDFPTGINTPIRDDKNFIRNAFPTLVNDFLTYQTGSLLTVRRINVKVANLSGQVVLNVDRNYQNGSLELGRLPKGTYVLTITSNDFKYQYIRKFTKN